MRSKNCMCICCTSVRKCCLKEFYMTCSMSHCLKLCVIFMSFSVVLSAWLSVAMEIMAVNLLATSPSTSTLPPSPCVEDSGFPLSSLDSEDYVFVEARHPNKVLEGLNSLRLNNAFCDVTLCCGGQEFPCHRIVLASFSSYFQVIVIVSVKRLHSRISSCPKWQPVAKHYQIFSNIFVFSSNREGLGPLQRIQHRKKKLSMLNEN